MVDRLNKPDKGTKDWHLPLNENFEDVEEASYVERTVADFEGGTLDTDFYNGDTSDFSVQNSVVESGSYALEGVTNGNEPVIYSNSGLDSYPQAGDVIEWKLYLTDTDNRAQFGFGLQEDSKERNADGYWISVRANDNILTIREDRGSNNSINLTNVDISSNLNEWLTCNIEWAADKSELNVTVSNSSGAELVSVTKTISYEYESGGIQFGVTEMNSNTTSVYHDATILERRETQARTNTQKGTTQLGNEVVPSGSIQTGPTTSNTNAKRAIYQDAPVDTTATQGTQSKLTLLQSGLNPAMFMERTLDGQGGAYGHQLQAPLGRISKVNNRLDFNYEDKSDVGFSIDSSDQGGTGINAGILDGTTQIYDVDAGDGTTITPDTRPREIGASYHFSDGDGIRTTVIPCPIPIAELGAVRVTFHGVTTNMNESGNNQSSVGVKLVSDGDNSKRFENNYSKLSLSAPEFNDGTIAIEADAIADEYRFVSQGNIENIQSANIGQFVRPAFVVADDFHTDGYGEIRIKQITVEPLPEVL